MTNTNNPLQRYFRQPAIYISLPSGGEHYPAGTLETTPNGEFPVFPMTAMDEITYRTADALFNGSAIVNVIKSCVPNILDPWQMNTSDMETILIAIRIASFGHQMEIESKCVHCEEQNDFGLDLRSVMEQIHMPDYNQTVQRGDIEVYFKPLTYQQQNQNAIQQFEDQKILRAVPDADLPEQEKLELINSALVKLGEMNVNAITDSINMIKAGNDIVSEPEFIKEFIRNCETSMYKDIQEQIVSLREQSVIPPLDITCNSCNNTYQAPFTMDVSNFFAQNS